jgi:hypothetical protein
LRERLIVSLIYIYIYIYIEREREREREIKYTGSILFKRPV